MKNVLELKEYLNAIPDEELAVARLIFDRAEDIEPSEFDVQQLRYRSGPEHGQLMAIEVFVHFED